MRRMCAVVLAYRRQYLPRYFIDIINSILDPTPAYSMDMDSLSSSSVPLIPLTPSTSTQHETQATIAEPSSNKTIEEEILTKIFQVSGDVDFSRLLLGFQKLREYPLRSVMKVFTELFAKGWLYYANQSTGRTRNYQSIIKYELTPYFDKLLEGECTEVIGTMLDLSTESSAINTDGGNASKGLVHLFQQSSKNFITCDIDEVEICEMIYLFNIAVKDSSVFCRTKITVSVPVSAAAEASEVIDTTGDDANVEEASMRDNENEMEGEGEEPLQATVSLKNYEGNVELEAVQDSTGSYTAARGMSEESDPAILLSFDVRYSNSKVSKELLKRLNVHIEAVQVQTEQPPTESNVFEASNPSTYIAELPHEDCSTTGDNGVESVNEFNPEVPAVSEPVPGTSNEKKSLWTFADGTPDLQFTKNLYCKVINTLMFYPGSQTKKISAVLPFLKRSQVKILLEQMESESLIYSVLLETSVALDGPFGSNCSSGRKIPHYFVRV